MGITEQGCIEGRDVCYLPKFGLRNNTQIWAFFFYAVGKRVQITHPDGFLDSPDSRRCLQLDVARHAICFKDDVVS